MKKYVLGYCLLVFAFCISVLTSQINKFGDSEFPLLAIVGMFFVTSIGLAHLAFYHYYLVKEVLKK